MSGAGLEPLRRRLEQVVFRHIGPGRAVEQLDLVVDGHAGLTFGFDVVELSTGRKDLFNLKLAPAGVRRSGNTDVYRQAPLLEALYRA